MNDKPQLISIKSAAQMLGVTPLTLRNWDKNGKLKALRHPMNNYRVYRREDIERLISSLDSIPRPVQKRQKKGPKKLQVKHVDEYGDSRESA